jgi:transaldolase
MIKVPATPECIPAIEQLIAEGIHVNVTLIFSLDGYERVARAYLAGLTQRAKKGLPLTIASVASFFVSRVDTLVDKRLDAAGSPSAAELKGQAAVAIGKLAYRRYKEIFAASRFQALQAGGARPQYLLWASTSTKNPAYPDLLYVEPLIGPQTINTVPDATLAAFRDHGRAARTIDRGLAEATTVLEQLAALGIDMAAVGEQLQTEGLALFEEAYAALLAAV